jgi:hypothetical protein
MTGGVILALTGRILHASGKSKIKKEKASAV